MKVFVRVLKQISSNLTCGEKQKETELSMERKGESDE